MEKSGLKVTTKAQFERLVNLMEKNPEIARGKPKFGMTKNLCKEIWDGFAIELNSLGPPTRTSQEWQRVWIHYKASVKKKLANNKKNYQVTGGGPGHEVSLNSLEECVSELLSLNEQVVPGGQAFGVENIVPATSEAYVPSQSTEASEVTIKESEIPRTPARRKNHISPEKERLELLKKQCETQTKLLKAIKDLEKNTYKTSEINKQLLRVKQKKLALYERQVNEATELHKLRVECEKMKIEKLKSEMNIQPPAENDAVLSRQNANT